MTGEEAGIFWKTAHSAVGLIARDGSPALCIIRNHRRSRKGMRCPFISWRFVVELRKHPR